MYYSGIFPTYDRALIRRKLASSARPIPSADMLDERFDEMRANAEDEWATGKGLVLSGRKHDWKDVDAALLKFKARTPAKT